MLGNFMVRRVLTREPRVCNESVTMSGGTGEGRDTLRIVGVSVADI